MMLTRERLMERLDYDALSGAFTWKAEPALGTAWNKRFAGTPAGNVEQKEQYLRIGIDGRRYKAHRLAWLYVYGCWPAGRLDHANTYRTDNRIGNLREASAKENACNRRIRRDNTSGFKGVRWRRQSRTWIASIQNDGVMIHLGTFETKEDAHAAYAKASVDLHGKFGRAA
jgi:hypothetical protein